MAERKRGRSPFRVRTQRERKRVSSAKRPAVGASMSPRSSQTQNVEPSRIVSGTPVTITAPEDRLKPTSGGYASSDGATGASSEGQRTRPPSVMVQGSVPLETELDNKGGGRNA